MKVSEEIVVQWRKEEHFNKRYQHNEEHTTCRIYNPKTQEEISTGTVKRHIKDNPCKDKARKASLKVALITIADKAFRTEVWNAYRLMKPNGRWTVKPKRKKVKVDD